MIPEVTILPAICEFFLIASRFFCRDFYSQINDQNVWV